MDQLVVLHEIFESFAKGTTSIQTLDPTSVEGRCASRVRRLLESCQKGQINPDVCQELADCFTDVYELKRLGDICRRAGLFDLAQKCYQKALSSGQDTHVRAVLMNNLGQVYARIGDLNKAILYYKKAAEGFEYAGNPSGKAHVLGNLGSAYRRAYDWDKAVESCFLSLRGFENQRDEFGVAQMTGSLGRVYSEMGERDLAILYFERSLKEFERLGDRRSAAWLLNRLGRAYAMMNRWEDSERAFKAGISTFEDLGQIQNSGVVLSNLGRMYLDRGSPDLARDVLERAVKLMRKEMIPAYPNAVAALGATYNMLAGLIESSPEAGSGKGPNENIRSSAYSDSRESQRRASHMYARASDCYGELSVHPRIKLTEMKVAAGLNRSLSYLARLAGETREDEAVALAERAASALEPAIASSGSRDRSRITAMKRGILGMKEVWSIGLSSDEPWRLTKKVSASVEFLMGAARDLGDVSSEACRSIHDGLTSLNGAIERDRQRKDPSEMLRASAAHFRSAEKLFERSGKGCSIKCGSKVGSAAELIEGILAAQAPDRGSSAVQSSDFLNYNVHRKALTQIGWSILASGFDSVGRSDWIYIWDDAMNLVELGPAGSPAERQRIDRSGKGRTSTAGPVEIVSDGFKISEPAAQQTEQKSTVFPDQGRQWTFDSDGGLYPGTGQAAAQVAVASPHGSLQLIERERPGHRSVIEEEEEAAIIGGGYRQPIVVESISYSFEEVESPLAVSSLRDESRIGGADSYPQDRGCCQDQIPPREQSSGQDRATASEDLLQPKRRLGLMEAIEDLPLVAKAASLVLVAVPLAYLVLHFILGAV